MYALWGMPSNMILLTVISHVTKQWLFPFRNSEGTAFVEEQSRPWLGAGVPVGQALSSLLCLLL